MLLIAALRVTWKKLLRGVLKKGILIILIYLLAFEIRRCHAIMVPHGNIQNFCFVFRFSEKAIANSSKHLIHIKRVDLVETAGETVMKL